MSIVQEGQLKGAFKGFRNRDTIFEFVGGGVWRQAVYAYAYQYAYMPNAKVDEHSGGYLLYVDGIDEPVAVEPV